MGRTLRARVQQLRWLKNWVRDCIRTRPEFAGVTKDDGEIGSISWQLMLGFGALAITDQVLVDIIKSTARHYVSPKSWGKRPWQI